jgi:hypothetical protein
MQILRGHAQQLLGKVPTQLKWGQRYHFVAGWLPWLADGLNLIFSIAALLWTLGMIFFPKLIDPPLIIFSLLPLSLFTFKTAKQFYLYQTHVNASVGQTIMASIAGLALSHTISRAILTGLVKKDNPFFRTPKLAARLSFTSAIKMVYEETMLAVAFLAVIYGVIISQGVGQVPDPNNAASRAHADSPDLLFWIVVLCIQTIPYLTAITMSLLGARAHGASKSIAEAK